MRSRASRRQLASRDPVAGRRRPRPHWRFTDARRCHNSHSERHHRHHRLRCWSGSALVAVPHAGCGLADPAQRSRLIATFIVGGQELQYQFSAGSLQNPLHLPALRRIPLPERDMSAAMRCGLCSENSPRSAISSPSMPHAASSKSGSRGCRAASRQAGKARTWLAGRIPACADLAVLARRRPFAARQCRRFHAFARRGRPLLSIDGVRLLRRRQSHSAAGVRRARRLVRRQPRNFLLSTLDHGMHLRNDRGGP